jgi:hypothetical protein
MTLVRLLLEARQHGTVSPGSGEDLKGLAGALLMARPGRMFNPNLGSTRVLDGALELPGKLAAVCFRQGWGMKPIAGAGSQN